METEKVVLDEKWGYVLDGEAEFSGTQERAEDEVWNDICRIESEGEYVGQEIEDESLYVFKIISASYQHKLVSLEDKEEKNEPSIRSWGCVVGYDPQLLKTREDAEKCAQNEIDKLEKRKPGIKLEEGYICVFKVMSIVRAKKRIPRPPEDQIINEESIIDGEFWPEGVKFAYEHEIIRLEDSGFLKKGE